MNIKLSIVLIAVIFISISATHKPVFKKQSIYETPIMCSNFAGKCVGSSYCTVCTNCSRCGYCKGGGSCGVCRISTPKYYTKPKVKTPKTKSSYTGKSRTRQPSKITTTPASTPNNFTAYLPNKNFILTDKTSLRSTPHSAAEVLQRLAADDGVQMLDSATEKYWCQVLFDGQIGWVKRHLLKRVGERP